MKSTSSAYSVGFPLAIAMLICASGQVSTTRAVRGDEVLVRGSGGSKRVLRRQGEVVDYTGRGVTMRLQDGRQENFPSDRIVRVTPRKSAEHAAADRLRLQGRFANALTAYRQARRNEARDWVRRLILSHEAECYAAEGQIRYAVETFLNVVRSDSTTPYFSTMPLPWSGSRLNADTEQAALEWLDQKNLPTAQLLGAAWLLSSPRRAVALESLRQLATNQDARVAFLAESQLWRSSYVTASLDDVRRWEKRVASMPTALRPGPYFVVGLALARHQQHEDAALAWLRIPLQYPSHYQLASAALWRAAESLRNTGQSSESVVLLREIIQRYPASDYVGRAREELKAAPNTTRPPQDDRGPE